ncbi:MAG: enolase C-terminal domain-like protein [Oscillospiraceae bacterium]
MNPAIITSVMAMQMSTDQPTPAVQAVVTTAGGAVATAAIGELYSTSRYAPKYLYDGEASYFGKGVAQAVRIVQDVVAPAVVGLAADDQSAVDGAIRQALEEAGIAPCVNLTAPVSVAALKAAGEAHDLGLYRHLGGRAAFMLPVGGHAAASGSKRYGALARPDDRPVFALVAHGFASFAEAQYGLWETFNAYDALLSEKFDILAQRGYMLNIPAGKVNDDEELLKLMVQGIEIAGHTGRIGIHLDAGANAYYDAENQCYRGLFSAADKSGADLLALYERWLAQYPIVILEDPFHQDDVDGFRTLCAQSGIQIVGRDLFGADVARIKRCIDAGCVNAVSVSLCTFETVSDLIEVTRYAKNRNVDVMPRYDGGEGVQTVADLAVGLCAGTLCLGGMDATSNRLIAIEQEIGPRARFYGGRGIKGARFSLRGEG